ncbi:MAG TPA: nuclear transport factor 2 family protein [Ohtaekwangia sp.]
MNKHEQLIRHFYKAFQNSSYTEMQDAYHEEAIFHDPVFQKLNSSEVKAMWQMLLSSAKDLKIEFSNVKADDAKGSCRWDAWYTFSKTGRKVHNIIYASFEFKDGKIYRHQDSFDLWRWSRQALGVTGSLLGWSSIIKVRIQRAARKSLSSFMQALDLTATW